MSGIEFNNTAIEALLLKAREDSLIHFAALLVVLAQSIAPVGLTGHLRRSIERTDPQDAASFILVVASALYSLFVERGTGIYAEEGNGRKTPWTYRGPGGRYYTTEGMRAQPFFWPALQMLASAP